MTCGRSQTHTPAGDFTGTDSFTYQATDGVLDSKPGRVSLNVQNVATALTGLAATTIAEGEVSHLTGTVVDAGVEESYSLTIDWGDESAVATYSLASGVKAFDITHQYQGSPDGWQQLHDCGGGQRRSGQQSGR